MSKKKKLLIVLGFIFVIFLGPGLVKADIGPKPTMDFKFVSDREFTISEGQQMECQDSECKNSKALEKVGPQEFSCTDNSCHSLAYSYAPYHKLIVEINGKRLESNIFKTKNFGSTYTVYISENSLSVDTLSVNKAMEIKSLFSKLVVALLITLGIEFVLLLFIIIIIKFPWKILIPFLLANITSVLALWFLTSWFNLTALSFVLIGEMIVVFYEALIYWLFLKKNYSYGKMIILSFVLNLVSFAITMFIGF